jgi:hypothetical protein
LSRYKKQIMQKTINKESRGSMTKEKRMTLNAEKRKVIADQFQSFYEDKVKDKLIQSFWWRIV